MSKTAPVCGLAALALALTACAPLGLSRGPATIHAEVPVRPAVAPLERGGQPVSVTIEKVTDARGVSPATKIGEIRATVRDAPVGAMVLDQDVALLVRSALVAQLRADGFRVSDEPGAPADFRLGVATRAFSLNIGERDELHIALDATLRDGSSDAAIWTGTLTEKADRYAGVMGNSRSSIAAYLGAGLSEAAAKTSAAVRDQLLRAYPRAIAVVPTTVRPEPAAAAVTPSATRGSTGMVSIVTTPPRAKVYVSDVYYGLTPLKLEFDPGTVTLQLKLDGYRAVSEKVAVRRGETTALEVTLEK